MQGRLRSTPLSQAATRTGSLPASRRIAGMMCFTLGQSKQHSKAEQRALSPDLRSAEHSTAPHLTSQHSPSTEQGSTAHSIVSTALHNIEKHTLQLFAGSVVQTAFTTSTTKLPCYSPEQARREANEKRTKEPEQSVMFTAQ